MATDSEQRWRTTALRLDDVADRLRFTAAKVWASTAGEQLRDTLLRQAGEVEEVAMAARDVARAVHSHAHDVPGTSTEF